MELIVFVLETEEQKRLSYFPFFLLLPMALTHVCLRGFSPGAYKPKEQKRSRELKTASKKKWHIKKKKKIKGKKKKKKNPNNKRKTHAKKKGSF